MAEITSSYLTIRRQWETGDRHGAKKLVTKEVTITIPATNTTAYGDGTNTVSATSFGMRSIEEVTNAVDSAGNVVLCTPSYDRATIRTYDVSGATDATRDANVAMFARIDGSNAGVFKLTVKGF